MVEIDPLQTGTAHLRAPFLLRWVAANIKPMGDDLTMDISDLHQKLPAEFLVLEVSTQKSTNIFLGGIRKTRHFGDNPILPTLTTVGKKNRLWSDTAMTCSSNEEWISYGDS